jgi:nitrogen regulatory protein P-II 2
MSKGGHAMKLITAIVKPDKLDDLIQAVSNAGAQGLTVTEVRGFGRQYGHLGSLRPADQKVLILPKVRLDILAANHTVEPITEAIAKTVNTGTIGDGKIWVCPVTSALRVRTGERDWEAV